MPPLLAAAPLNLALRHPFTIARGTESLARNVLVRLRHGRWCGLGEGAPRAYYGQTQRGALAALRKMAPRLARGEPAAWAITLSELERDFPREKAALAAVDLALHDLQARSLGLPLWKYWGLAPRSAPPTSFTLGLDSLENIRRKVEEAQAFPILKIKMGGPGDLEILREVRRLCPRKILRVDANGGWTEREAAGKVRELERLEVELLEQPLPPGNPQALRRLQRRTRLPVVADESAVTPADVPLLRGCVAGINLKLVKCGGLGPARRMIHVARACGLKVMLGCMIESSLLITAAAHLAPLADYLDLDGALLLRKDPFRGARLGPDARFILPDAPGLGVHPAEG